MKKNFLLFLLIFFWLASSSQNVKFSEVKIYLQKENLGIMARLGIPVDDGVFHKEGYWQTVLSQRDLQKINGAGFRVEVLQDDYQKHIESRNAEWLKQNKEFKKSNLAPTSNPSVSWYKVPEHFDLGSMGGFYTLQEVITELDSMVLLYPNLITAKQQVSTQTTIQGRPLYYVKISKNPNVNEPEPKIFYNGLTHAREPAGMQQLIFYMWYLLENYETDPEVKYLLDNLEMYFIPVMNPDGYEYNYSMAPIGGGSWRKNLRDDGNGDFGVDLNRNYGYEWGYDDIGSSPYPADETFRGTAAFSEPETQIVRDLSNQVHFTEALNYHTYSDIFLFPWCYIIKYTPDSLTFVNFADIMTRQNRYSTGLPGELLYTTNGDINDWMYGEQTAKPKVFSYTPETGDQIDGFWPSPDRIIPICQENMYQNIMMAHLALKYGETRDVQPSIVSGRQGYFRFEFERYGLDAPANYTVSITPMDTAQITHVGTPRFFTNPGQFQTYTDSIAYTLSPKLTVGTQFKYIIKLSNGTYTFNDTVTKYFGPKLVVFQDSCNQFTKWVSTKWNISNTNYYTPTGSITDSPAGNYSNNTNVSVTTWNPIDLKDSPVAVLSYWTKWDTENGYDYVQVKVTTDDGLHYTTLKGRYTKNGSANEVAGKPVYDGKQLSWVNEEVVLDGYTNQNIHLQFTLISDASGSGDGYYFDDFSVSIIDMSNVGIENQTKLPVYLSGPVPNPASGDVRISYKIPGNLPAGLEVTDSRGSTVKKIALNDASGTVGFSSENLAAGIYFYRILGSFGSSEVKKLVVVR